MSQFRAFSVLSIVVLILTGSCRYRGVFTMITPVEVTGNTKVLLPTDSVSKESPEISGLKGTVQTLQNTTVLADVLIYLKDADGNRLHGMRTDSAGHFTTTADPGLYQLEVQHDDKILEMGPVQLKAGVGSHIRIGIEAGKGYAYYSVHAKRVIGKRKMEQIKSEIRAGTYDFSQVHFQGK